MAGVVEAAGPDDWRSPDPANTLYMQVQSGTVVIELAPQFAPNVIDNIRRMVRAGYFADASVVRSQENYVAQWAVWGSDGPAPLPDGVAESVTAEFYRSADGLAITEIDSRDAYADVVGFVDGFPVGRDQDGERAWLVHCNSMVGVGRDVAADSGTGAEMYAVTGHAPRHLDRNVVLIGRVLHGMEHLTTLPRGTEALGFYASTDDYVPVKQLRFASDVPEDERLSIDVLRTDTETFEQLVEARRHRAEEWFIDPTDHVGICNVPLPVRVNTP